MPCSTRGAKSRVTRQALKGVEAGPGGCPFPTAFSGGLGPPHPRPPSEGLSADNQGTDSERRREESTQAPDGILISGAECQRQAGVLSSSGSGGQGGGWEGVLQAQ